MKKKYNIKVLYEAHDFYLDLKEQKNKKYRKMIFQKLFLPKIDGIICHHETMKTLYKNYLPNQNYLVAKTGIKKIYTKNINENILAYVGTLDKRKSIKDIFLAINILNEYNLKLIIIGGKNSEIINKYKNIARKLNVWDRVEITGWIPRKRVDEILKKVKIGIVPLDDVFFNCYLTSPMKIFNYFSHGIPVVGTNIPTVNEIINDKYGLLYKKDDPSDLAKNIRLLLRDEELYDNLSKNIYNYCNNNTWKKRGEVIINFAKKL